MYDEDCSSQQEAIESILLSEPHQTVHGTSLYFSDLTPGGCQLAVSEINRFSLTDNQHFALPNTCLSSTIDIIIPKVHLI